MMTDLFEPSKLSSTARLAWFALFALGLAIVASLGSCGCTPAQGPRVGVSDRSVVTLLRVARADELACSSGGACRNTWEPAGSAFALVHTGQTRLATAAHCVPYALGSQVRYLAPSGWGHGVAVLVMRDPTRDVALLDPLDPEALVPLTIGPEPIVGEPVRAFSSLFDASSGGHVRAWLSRGWYETDQTIAFGWSGSPELDAQGRVWGVVAKCPTGPGGGQCLPGAAYVTAVP